ncbi:uncharacterized protein [Ptychodera flava]|uniref:uncharacterized protein n=1 Tax=Ptychodera flava TaxID=63121 RepID=UPI00396AA343
MSEPIDIRVPFGIRCRRRSDIMTTAFVYAPDEPEHTALIHGFCELISLLIRGRIIINIFNILDERETDDKVINDLREADRVVLVTSKSLKTLWDERNAVAAGQRARFSDAILDYCIAELQQGESRGREKFFEIHFEFIGNDQSTMKVAQNRHKISPYRSSTIESFCGKLHHVTGRRPMSHIEDTMCCTQAGKAFFESVRKLQTRGIQELVQHGKTTGFSPCDLDFHCLDTLLQHRVITEDELQMVKQSSTPKEKLVAVRDIISKKATIFPEYRTLVDVWLDNLGRQIPAVLLRKRCILIENMRHDVKPIVDYLIQEDIITIHAGEVITVGAPQTSARRLLDEIPKTKRALNAFADALEMYNQDLAKLVNLKEYFDGDDTIDGDGMQNFPSSEDNSYGSQLNQLIIPDWDSGFDMDDGDETSPRKPTERSAKTPTHTRIRKSSCRKSRHYQPSSVHGKKAAKEKKVDRSVLKTDSGYEEDQVDGLVDDCFSDGDDLSETDSCNKPPLCPGLRPVDSLEALHISSNSVHVRWFLSGAPKTSRRLGFRVTCLQLNGNGRNTVRMTEVLESPSAFSWKRGCLSRGDYRISVSVLYGDEDYVESCSSTAKWINVKIEKRQVLRKVFRSKKISKESTSVRYQAKKGGASLKKDKQESPETTIVICNDENISSDPNSAFKDTDFDKPQIFVTTGADESDPTGSAQDDAGENSTRPTYMRRRSNAVSGRLERPTRPSNGNDSSVRDADDSTDSVNTMNNGGITT